MKYLNSINQYRALSIVLIVALHSVFVAEIKFDSYLSRLALNFISGATINFVFISGFLFYQVFYKRYSYSVFVKARVNRFLKPYLFLSILPILFCLITVPEYWNNTNYIEFNNGANWRWYIISIIKYIITGAHITAYWYIPFVILLVMMSPLHMSFVKMKLKQQLIVFGVLLLVASVIQRPHERVALYQAIQSVIYFTPLYLMGIICAIHKDRVYKILKGTELVLLILVLIFTVLHTNEGEWGFYRTKFLIYNGIDLSLFKMVFMCLFFMIWLHRFENVKSKTINILANTSFAIYFLHVYILKFLVELKTYFKVSIQGYESLVYVSSILASITLSVLIAKVVNRFLPNYCFMLIGYGKSPKKNLKKLNFK